MLSEMIARGDCYTGNQSVERRSDDRNGFTDWFKTFIDGSAYWLLAVIMDVRIRACLARRSWLPPSRRSSPDSAPKLSPRSLSLFARVMTGC